MVSDGAGSVSCVGSVSCDAGWVSGGAGLVVGGAAFVVVVTSTAVVVGEVVVVAAATVVAVAVDVVAVVVGAAFVVVGATAVVVGAAVDSEMAAVFPGCGTALSPQAASPPAARRANGMTMSWRDSCTRCSFINGTTSRHARRPC